MPPGRSVALQCSRYAEIRVPLAILAGRGDRVALWDWHSERLHRTVPGSELTVLEDAGHQVLHSHPGAVVEAVVVGFGRLMSIGHPLKGLAPVCSV